ncbi:hypothetical protein Efla_007423 [Eimeria flavescens]
METQLSPALSPFHLLGRSGLPVDSCLLEPLPSAAAAAAQMQQLLQQQQHLAQDPAAAAAAAGLSQMACTDTEMSAAAAAAAAAATTEGWWLDESSSSSSSSSSSFLNLQPLAAFKEGELGTEMLPFLQGPLSLDSAFSLSPLGSSERLQKPQQQLCAAAEAAAAAAAAARLHDIEGAPHLHSQLLPFNPPFAFPSCDSSLFQPHPPPPCSSSSSSSSSSTCCMQQQQQEVHATQAGLLLSPHAAAAADAEADRLAKEYNLLTNQLGNYCSSLKGLICDSCPTSDELNAVLEAAAQSADGVSKVQQKLLLTGRQRLALLGDSRQLQATCRSLHRLLQQQEDAAEYNSWLQQNAAVRAYLGPMDHSPAAAATTSSSSCSSSSSSCVPQIPPPQPLGSVLPVGLVKAEGSLPSSS